MAIKVSVPCCAPSVDPADMRPMSCDIDPSCVNWVPPSAALCDPCYDPTNAEHVEIWNAAWKATSSFLYRELGCQWPGGCFTETYRPCARRRCYCRAPSCEPCGIYDYLPISEALCLPLVAVQEVWIGPNLCTGDECPTILTPGDGFRVEYFGVDEVRLVIEEDAHGCCPQWPTQDMCHPTGEDNTWHVTVHTGKNPPPHVLDGAVAMATDIFKDCVVRGCRPPGNVTSRSFDGSTIQIDHDLPASWIQRLLQQTLDAQKDMVIEQFGDPGIPYTFHRVDGPRPLEAGATCDMGCGTRSVVC